jgi:hypothetical protein
VAGERAAEVRARLEAVVGPVGFGDLRAHLGRDAVFVVGATASLLECAVAVALDDVEAVSGWLASGALRRPGAEEREAWSRDEARRWQAVVVQPYVLVQDPSD